jgi:hypothetical protein
MTTPRYRQAAADIRAQIEDGTLTPGSPAPSGAALARATGYSPLTCRKALTLLITEGILRPGPSPNASPRIAGTDPAGPDRAVRAAALSGALADRRGAAGHTQLELAEITGYSVTTIGHAETGRVWQSRRFWETADKVLNAAGELLRLHDAYSAALARPAAPATAETTAGTGKAPATAAAPPPVPVIVTITWPDGTTTTVRQPTRAPARQETAMTDEHPGLEPIDPAEPYAARMTLIRRYRHLVLKFTPPCVSDTGRHEASWIGGSADAATAPELLAAVRAAMGDCGGEGHLWITTGRRSDEDSGAEFITQTLTCADCPPGQTRDIPADHPYASIADAATASRPAT